MDVTVTSYWSPPNIEDYAGKWIAIRGEAVVAAHESLSELLKRPDVQNTDILRPVLPPGERFLGSGA